jgi:hypothetical protein
LLQIAGSWHLKVVAAEQLANIPFRILLYKSPSETSWILKEGGIKENTSLLVA